MTRQLAGFLVAVTGFTAFASIPSIAQQAEPAQPLRFEVAAVKPAAPNQIGALTQYGVPGGEFRMRNVPLKQMVETGLAVPDYALKAPSWLQSVSFDVHAKLPNRPANAKLPNQGYDWKEQAEMLKALLVERFGLKWHEETGIVPGYELVTDKKVLVQPATLMERMLGRGGRSWGASGISGTNMPMSELAERLGEALGRPVVDTTHLTGGYDVKLAWRPSDDATVAELKRHGYDADNLPDSVFTAVREQLGLRLQPAKVPSKVIVIDQINRKPTD